MQRTGMLWAAAVLLAGGAASLHAKGAAERGIRFDSAGVLDLAQRPLANAPRKPLAIESLAAGTAAAILAAPAIAADPPALKFSEDEFGCASSAPACLRQHEAQRIAASDGAVKRLDKRLAIAAGAGPPAVFVDWTQPETKAAEGDSEAHWYLGKLPGSGYHRVEVQFGHDAPGNFLIDPRSGKMAFVHNGSDFIAPSPDGAHLVTFNVENPPLSVRVAALAAGGPRLALVCAAPGRDERSAVAFKGWTDANAFDLVIDAAAGSAKRAIAVRASRSGDAWHVAAAEPDALRAAGIACTTP